MLKTNGFKLSLTRSLQFKMNFSGQERWRQRDRRLENFKKLLSCRNLKSKGCNQVETSKMKQPIVNARRCKPKSNLFRWSSKNKRSLLDLTNGMLKPHKKWQLRLKIKLKSIQP
jgi:hypothetical protein